MPELAADDAGGRTLCIRLAAFELMYLKSNKGMIVCGVTKDHFLDSHPFNGST